MCNVLQLALRPALTHNPDVMDGFCRYSCRLKAPMFYRYVQYWLGDQSLLLQEGEAWKSSRHLITPAFHFTILQEYAVRPAPSRIP